jgi:hypothetical protein
MSPDALPFNGLFDDAFISLPLTRLAERHPLRTRGTRGHPLFFQSQTVDIWVLKKQCVSTCERERLSSAAARFLSRLLEQIVKRMIFLLSVLLAPPQESVSLPRLYPGHQDTPHSPPVVAWFAFLRVPPDEPAQLCPDGHFAYRLKPAPPG